jgi:aminopeptidase
MLIHPKYQELADNIVNYSVSLKENESVLIETANIPDVMVVSLINAVYKAKGIPIVRNSNTNISTALLVGTNDKRNVLVKNISLFELQQVQAFISVRGSINSYNNKDVLSTLTQYKTMMREVVDYRVNNTKWCVLSWPTPIAAQEAKLSTDEFEEFFFRVCCYDYKTMAEHAEKLKQYMEKTNKVRIKGPGTDIQFSIKNIPVVTCCGNFNIPDGEVFTAPVLKSANGTIKYNCKTEYMGYVFENISLVFRHGKITEASCSSNNAKELNEIFKTDKGAKYLGEFALGINPMITKPMTDILFDEKIYGSFHLTPGQCYSDASNGNDKSCIHWDLVCIQTPEFGGGEIYFDGKLIRKNGEFVVKELECLNK